MLTANQLRLHRLVFLLSAIYNVVWGSIACFFPYTGLRLLGLPGTPDDVTVLFAQCIGMFVATYAIGYLYLAINPTRYAPFAVIALIGKILGPIGWIWAWRTEQLPLRSGLTIITNDLIWWVPYAWFIYKTMIVGRNKYPQAALTSPSGKSTIGESAVSISTQAEAVADHLEVEVAPLSPATNVLSVEPKATAATPVPTEPVRRPVTQPARTAPATTSTAGGTTPVASPRPAATRPPAATGTLTSAGTQTAANRPVARPVGTPAPATPGSLAGQPARPAAPRPAPTKPVEPKPEIAPPPDGPQGT